MCRERKRPEKKKVFCDVQGTLALGWGDDASLGTEFQTTRGDEKKERDSKGGEGRGDGGGRKGMSKASGGMTVVEFYYKKRG